MTERLDALERLQRLRETGGVSEAEFEREKARLLGSGTPAHAPAPVRRETPAWVWILVGFVSVALIALLAWLLSGMNQGRDEEERASTNVRAENKVQAAPEPRDDTPAVRRLSEREQLAAAFRAAFGDRTTRQLQSGEARFTPGRLVWIGERAVLISPGEIPDACHGCYGSLAIHYLRPAGAGFEVEGEWLERAGGSSFGAAGSDWGVSDRYGPNPVVYSESGFTGQGYTCTVMTMTELAPREPIESDGVPIHMDNSGAVLDDTGQTSGGDPPREVSGEIVNVAKGRGFTVRFTGTERFEETYVYRGGRFVRTSGESRATC